jgi:phosphoribosylformylglycinamidine (FGAM) synthase-like enzyme
MKEPEVTLELAKEPRAERGGVRARGAVPRAHAVVHRARRALVMWSEHCSYKSSRVHLEALPTKGPKVIQGPGENAGVVDIGDGWACVFKMESHNHPSYIEPYQGAATGVGGILRDVFTMGARPIANLDSLRFGAPDAPAHALPRARRGRGHRRLRQRHRRAHGGRRGAVRRAYDGNILVNALAVGVAAATSSSTGAPRAWATRSSTWARAPGATASTARRWRAPSSTTESEKRPTVQVGDPFMEKLLLEACLEIFARTSSRACRTWAPRASRRAPSRWRGARATARARPRRSSPAARSGSRPTRCCSASRRSACSWSPSPAARRGCSRSARSGTSTSRSWAASPTPAAGSCAPRPGYDPLSGDPAREVPQVVVDLPVDLLTDAAPVYERPCVDDPRPRRYAGRPATAEPSTPARPPGADLARPTSARARGSTASTTTSCATAPCCAPGRATPRWCACSATTARTQGRIEKLLALSSDCNGRFCELDPRPARRWPSPRRAATSRASAPSRSASPTASTSATPQRPEIMAQFRDASTASPTRARRSACPS